MYVWFGKTDTWALNEIPGKKKSTVWLAAPRLTERCMSSHTPRSAKKFPDHTTDLLPGVLLAAGHTVSEEGGAPFLTAVNIQDGSQLWLVELPAAVVKGGTALDHQGRIVVSLEDGRILCFAAAE